MTNEKDSAVHGCEEPTLAEQLINFLDDTDWELSAFVRENADAILAALRQPTQSDAVLTKMNKWCKAVGVEWGQGSQMHNIARFAVDIVRAALQEQSK
jgi:hypothetical protein